MVNRRNALGLWLGVARRERDHLLVERGTRQRVGRDDIRQRDGAGKGVVLGLEERARVRLGDIEGVGLELPELDKPGFELTE